MCRKPVDSLPLDTSIFSGSWRGIGLGVLIIVTIVIGVTRYQSPSPGAVAAAQRIKNLPTPTATFTPTATPTVTPTPTATPTVTPTPTPAPREHVIQSGETLLFIAGLYGVTVEEITRLNRIEETTTLNVDQILLIPPGPPVDVGDDLPPQIIYVVASGDTLSSIAYDHGTTVEGIIAANPDQNLDLIFPGQELVVPLFTPTPTATPTLLPTETTTPPPPYIVPNLLNPAHGEVVDSPTLLLNWTATTLLASDEFYVVELTWLNGATTEYWVKNSSLRIPKEERPANGRTTWRVVIKRRTGTSAQGLPTGITLSEPGEDRVFEWR
jgi:LysM repeat protein